MTTNKQQSLLLLITGAIGALYAEQLYGVGTTLYLWAIMGLFTYSNLDTIKQRRGAQIILTLLLVIAAGMSITEDPWVIGISLLSMIVGWIALAVSLSSAKASYMGFLLAPISMLLFLL